jgi:hypothetical protein
VTHAQQGRVADAVPRTLAGTARHSESGVNWPVRTTNAKAHLYQRCHGAPECARAFAMTAIAQCRETHTKLGRGHYTPWTGDVGRACYLWDCLTGSPQCPTVDVM